MNIELIEYRKDHLIERDGNYLVRTVCTSPLKRIQFLQARCTRVFNQKANKFETSIDVNNQIVTHISKEAL